MNNLYGLILGVLSVWRITHLFTSEDGPGRILARLRSLAGWSCFYCLSVWVAAPFAFVLGSEWRERLLLWPALSGAAILLERATAAPAAVYTEDPIENESEDTNELLWKSEK